jgi:hypothetical protein
MIDSIEFRNFKVLRNTSLPLGRFTLIVGPNGSSKSTAIEGLRAVAGAWGQMSWERVASAGVNARVEITARMEHDGPPCDVSLVIRREGEILHRFYQPGGAEFANGEAHPFRKWLSRLRVYSLRAEQIAAPVQLEPPSNSPKTDLAFRGSWIGSETRALNDLTN